MGKKILPIILLIAIIESALSQPFIDLLNIRYQYFPGVKYKSKPGKMVIHEMTYNFTLPIQLKNKNTIITGATYDQLNFNFTDTSAKKVLYGLTLQAGYLHYLKQEKWKVLIVALPKLSSDNIFHSKNEYQQGGVIIFTHKKKDNLAYKFGLYYNSEFFGNYFIPLVGIEWKPKPKIYLYGVFPNNLNLEYRVNPKFYVGLSYVNLTQSYRMSGSNSFVRNGDRFWGNIQMKFFINYYIKKQFMIFVETGYTFYRRYETYKNHSEFTSNYFFSHTGNGALINAGIAFRIRLDNKNDSPLKITF